jgi:hypothetical protein
LVTGVNWTYTIPTINTGDIYNVVATRTDEFNNTFVDNTTNELKIQRILDTVVPTVVSDTVSGGSSVDVIGTVGSKNLTDSNSTFSVIVKNTSSPFAEESGTIAYDATGINWTYSLTNIPEGTTYNVTVTRTDEHGDKYVDTTSNELVVNAVAPAPATAEAPGDAMEGGFFAGYYSKTRNGVPTHKIIIAPKSTTNSKPGISTGFTDWVVPTYYQMMIVYYFLKPTTDANRLTGGVRTPYKAKPNPYSVLPYAPNTLLKASIPTQTAATNFKLGGSEALDVRTSAGAYWAYNVVYDPGIIANGSLQIMFDDGGFYGGYSNDKTRYIRLVPV